jgi:uncharacterized protein
VIDPTQADAPLTLARWELRTPNGAPPIRGDLRIPSEREPESAVVVCHGFKGFKDWGFFPALSQALAARGHAVLTFNFSHSGIGPDGVDFSDLPRFADNTHTRNVEEIHLVLDALSEGQLLRTPPRRVGLFGHSRGGGEAILAAAKDPRVNALVTWSAIASVERWSDEQIAAWERGETVVIPNARTGEAMPINPSYWEDLTMNRRRLEITRAAQGVSAPWLIVHGEEDETVAVEDAHQLHGATEGRAELLLIGEAGHTFGATHPLDEIAPPLRIAMDATGDWMDRFLAADAAHRAAS